MSVLSYKSQSLDFFFNKDLTNMLKDKVSVTSSRLCSEVDRGWLELFGIAGIKDA